MAVKTSLEQSLKKEQTPKNPVYIPTFPKNGSGLITKANSDAIRAFNKYEICAKLVLLAELTLITLSTLGCTVLIIMMGIYSNTHEHPHGFIVNKKAFLIDVNVDAEFIPVDEDYNVFLKNFYLVTAMIIGNALNLGLSVILAQGIKNASTKKCSVWILGNLLVTFGFVMFGAWTTFHTSYYLTFLGFLLVFALYKIESVIVVDKYVTATQIVSSLMLTV